MSHSIQTAPSEKLYLIILPLQLYGFSSLQYYSTFTCTNTSTETACFLYLDIFSSPTVDYVHKYILVLQKNMSN